MSDSQKALWLVKSGGQILGPFSAGQIESLLRSKELVSLDEACLPLKRWTYLRDEKKFTAVIEELRRLDFANTDMDDHTETVGVGSDEFTASLTDVVGTQPGGGAEIVYDRVEEVVDTPKANQQQGSVPRFGTAPIAKKEVSQFSKVLLKIAIVLVVASGIAFFAKFYMATPLKELGQSDDFVKQGFEALQYGDYTQALELFDRSYKLDSTRQEIYVHLGSLLIQIDGQTVRGKRFLNEVLDFDDKNKKLAYTGLGIANLFDGEVRFAEKNFQAALELDSEYKPALLNLGITMAYRQEYDKALSFYRKVIYLGARDNIVFFLMADSFLEKWKKTRDPKWLAEAKRSIDAIRMNGRDYLQESLVYSAYLQTLMDKKITDEQLIAIIEVNPHLTSDHRHELMVYRQTASWVQLLEKCKIVTNKLARSINASILKAICHSKAGQHEQAKQSIRTALSQENANILAQTVYAYILQEAGEEETSLVALGRATEMNRSKEFALPIYLQARFCSENRDFECARENWMELIKNKSDSLTAIVKLANLNFDEGKTIGLEREIYKGRALSKGYIPLLKLEDKAKKSEAVGG